MDLVQIIKQRLGGQVRGLAQSFGIDIQSGWGCPSDPRALQPCICALPSMQRRSYIQTTSHVKTYVPANVPA